MKTRGVTSPSSKNDDSKLESIQRETTNLAENADITSDFPALGTANEQYKTPVWNKPLGVSFSDKLKAGNTSSYSYNETSIRFNDKTKEQQKTSMKSKVDEDESKTIVSMDKMNREEVECTPSDDGFSVVKSKSKKKYEEIEWSNKKD